jgi:hypothetical protein
MRRISEISLCSQPQQIGKDTVTSDPMSPLSPTSKLKYIQLSELPRSPKRKPRDLKLTDMQISILEPTVQYSSRKAWNTMPIPASVSKQPKVKKPRTEPALGFEDLSIVEDIPSGLSSKLLPLANKIPRLISDMHSVYQIQTNTPNFQMSEMSTPNFYAGNSTRHLNFSKFGEHQHLNTNGDQLTINNRSRFQSLHSHDSMMENMANHSVWDKPPDTRLEVSQFLRLPMHNLDTVGAHPYNLSTDCHQHIRLQE